MIKNVFEYVLCQFVLPQKAYITCICFVTQPCGLDIGGRYRDLIRRSLSLGSALGRSLILRSLALLSSDVSHITMLVNNEHCVPSHSLMFLNV